MQSTGTRRERRSMSCIVKSTPASWATASRCRTVLVEPPMAMSNDIADDERRSVLEQPAAIDVGGDDRAVARQRETQRLGQTVHRVGREHARARSAAGAGATLDLGDLRVAARLVGPHHHGVDQVDAAALKFSGLHRPARDEDRRDVEPHGGHQHAGGDLVAVRNADQRVDLVGGGHVLDAVGDDLARRQRVEHAVVAHGDAVVDGDGVGLGGEAP